MVTPSPCVRGRRVVETLGLVLGNTVAARPVGQDLIARWKKLLGGEIEPYSELLAEACGEAVDRMIAEARRLGGNAVLDVDFATTHLMGSAAEIIAYGNAVVLEEPGTELVPPRRSPKGRPS
jgi:uncharacterized protein YbjQ (UPF0145 family)